MLRGFILFIAIASVIIGGLLICFAWLFSSIITDAPFVYGIIGLAGVLGVCGLIVALFFFLLARGIDWKLK